MEFIESYNILEYLSVYVQYMFIYLAVKNGILGFMERPLELDWKLVIFYPFFATVEISYILGRTLIFILGLFLNLK